MYDVMIANKGEVFTNKEDVIDYLCHKIRTIANIDREMCIAINSDDYILNIWIVDANKSVLLFYNPLDSHEDCKISCSGNKEEMSSPRFELQDNGNSLNGCNAYNLISIEQAVEEIQSVINNGCVSTSGKWYAW